MNNSCLDKYIIAFIDTENVPSNCFSGLASLVEYKYKNHKNAGYYCYGIDDQKSTVSCGWKQQTDKLKGLMRIHQSIRLCLVNLIEFMFTKRKLFLVNMDLS